MPEVTFSGNGGLPKTFDIIRSMLSQSPQSDKHLLLAYGYASPPKGIRDAVSMWLNVDEERKITFIVGLLPERKVEKQLGSIEGKKTYEPYLEERIDISALLRTTKFFFGGIISDLYTLDEDRINVYGVTGYHGKACVLLSSMTGRMTSSNQFHWDPSEAVIGSSNLTENALFNNFELDIHLHRGSEAVKEFSSSTKDYFWELLDRPDYDCDVSTSVSSQLQALVNEAVEEEERARRAKHYREMEQESQRLLDADN